MANQKKKSFTQQPDFENLENKKAEIETLMNSGTLSDAELMEFSKAYAEILGSIEEKGNEVEGME